MGLFSKSDIEKKLEEIYMPLFQTMMCLSLSQAKKHFRSVLQQAKADSINEGTSDLPSNYGDIRLEKESTNEEIKAIFTKLRKEGVRNEDIRWWWNTHDLERRMMVEVDVITRMALFTKLKEEGRTPEEASKVVRKAHPMFGDPNDTTYTSGKDTPLPIEFKDRINIYVEKRISTNPEQFKKDIEVSSTFNALIREEIAKGNV